MATTPVFLPGESHGQRSLAGYNPWGRKESDMTKATQHIVVKNPPASAGDVKVADSIPGSERSPGGGHDNPLQYSCLENPMDRGVWCTTCPEGHKESDTTGMTQHEQQK